MKRNWNERIFFLAAQRTPFGSYLGALAKLSATDLGVHAAQAALKAASVSPQQIDHVVFGNVLQTSKDAIYLARHIGLRAEVPVSTPAVTVNRLCGSGFEAIVQGAQLINGKEADCVLVGGTESMSQAPHVIRGARTGLSLGQSQLEDSLWECLNDTFVNSPMAMTAERLAEIYNITQDEVDNYSLRSHTRYHSALKEGALVNEITPIECGTKKAPRILTDDEHPRKDASLDKLKSLPKVFKQDGVIHAGAASGICDGAGALILCSEQFLTRSGLMPLGEFIAHAVVGCDPKIMGIGPVPAMKQALSRAELSFADMDLIEVNEAFAPQVLAVKKELELPEDKLNIHGGAIAVGHPLAASGARIMGHLLHTLTRTQKNLAIGSACIGGGQGIAVILRRL